MTPICIVLQIKWKMYQNKCMHFNGSVVKLHIINIIYCTELKMSTLVITKAVLYTVFPSIM